MSIAINLNEFDYFLPPERIAQYPIPERDKSRLIVFNKDKTISHYLFHQIHELIPENTLLIRNRSKVLPARFFFKKQTGGQVEILLVEPIEPSPDPKITIASPSPNIWKVIIGGKRIERGSLLEPPNSNSKFSLNIQILEREKEFALAKFQWFPERISFSQIVTELGHIPLPPYIKRKDQTIDNKQYQTVYASTPGSVAAPTAGLHFTKNLISQLIQKKITFADIILHIGPGTFKPIKGEISEHIMHSENFCIEKMEIEKIYNFISRENSPIIAIGTTSVRAIESLYWIANQIFLRKDNSIIRNPTVHQWEPYNNVKMNLSNKEALEILIDAMGSCKVDRIYGSTQLFIIPSYKIKYFDALITNFHLPRSTLLLLIASFVGEYWRQIYQEGIEKNYRFLSYGDSSLLWKIDR
ncbi:MAG: S-adenosylmethionine:tRNA ribosyltransferase-isomerase [Candidatus Kapaibacteriales bacterium]